MWLVVYFSDKVAADVNVTFKYEADNGTDLVNTDKLTLTVSEPTYLDNKTTIWNISAEGKDPGHVTLVITNITDGTNTTTYK